MLLALFKIIQSAFQSSQEWIELETLQLEAEYGHD